MTIFLGGVFISFLSYFHRSNISYVKNTLISISFLFRRSNVAHGVGWRCKKKGILRLLSGRMGYREIKHNTPPEASGVRYFNYGE